MKEFIALSSPWWVNLLIAIPFIFYYFLKKNKAFLSYKTLAALFCFGVAFGFVEAAVVVYLRAILGIQGLAPFQVVAGLPIALVRVEFFREIATLIMLAAIAYLAEEKIWERMGSFLWVFATWDIFYYVFLWVVLRWPDSFTTTDVLFLVPVPWYAQVWFPILVSVLSLGAVLLGTRRSQVE